MCVGQLQSADLVTNQSTECKEIHRSIYSMEDSALPKRALLAGNGRTNLLTTKYTPKVVKGDDSEDNWRDKIKNTLSGIDTAKERNQWKREEKCSRITATLDRRVVLQTELRNTVAQRSALTGEERYLALGSGSAYGQSLQNTERSNTELLAHKGQADRRKIRALKSGHMPHLKTNAQVKNSKWKQLQQNDREKLVKCGCCCGGVQDMEHILTDCGMTEEAVEEALTAIETIRGEKAKATAEERLRAAFRKMGYENDGERKVRKVMGKLHNEIRRVLRDQGTTIQTHAAMPIYTQHQRTTCSIVVKSLGLRARHVAVIDRLRVFMTRPRERDPTGSTQISPT